MSLRGRIAYLLAADAYRKVSAASLIADKLQQETFKNLIERARYTQFGKQHGFSHMKNYEDFKDRVPTTDYEGFKPWIDKLLRGEKNVLWPGSPIYLTKTSGTTSGTKFIPITSDSISNHLSSARNALLLYANRTGNIRFLNHKLLFLSGSPRLERVGGTSAGRLSGIVNHHIPFYLKLSQVPTWKTNCLEDWEQKVDAIVTETRNTSLGLISGIPPWVQMYFDRLTRNQKHVCEVFPNLSVYVHGGVNFEPYRSRFLESFGKEVDTVETYPASEGFIAYQDSQEHGLLLTVNQGIFFEFILAAEADNPYAKRMRLQEVVLNENYAIVLNTNAGLWGYLLGDTVRFVSLEPYRITVTGRTKQFISAFGEHVIVEEADTSLAAATASKNCSVTEFTVAPFIPAAGDNKLAYHEWFIEFDRPPTSLEKFSSALDGELRARNIYYDNLVGGKVLQPLKIRALPKGTFIKLMQQEGKLGGQNKVPHLSNGRLMAEKIAGLLSEQIN